MACPDPQACVQEELAVAGAQLALFYAPILFVIMLGLFLTRISLFDWPVHYPIGTACNPLNCFRCFRGTPNRSFWISYVLFSIVQIAGSLVFIRLERPSELAFNEALHLENEKFTTATAELMVLEAAGQLTPATLAYLKTLEPSTQPSRNWNLHGARFFSLTLSSTIGYGSFAPATDEGRVFTIVFSLVGIAFGGYFFACLGERLIHIYRKYVMRRLGCLQRCAYSDRQRAESIIGEFRIDEDNEDDGEGNDGPRFDRMKLIRRFRKYDTDGNGFISKTELRKLLKKHGLALTSDELSEIMKKADDGDGFLTYEEAATAVHIYIETMNGETKIDTARATLSIVSVILVFALAIGSVCFWLLAEGEDLAWSFLTAFYFSVITLTTIGLGDFSPPIPPVTQSWDEGPTLNVLFFWQGFIYVGLGVMALWLNAVGDVVTSVAEQRLRLMKGRVMQNVIKNVMVVDARELAESESKST